METATPTQRQLHLYRDSLCNWVFICVISARHFSGLHAHLQEQWMLQFLYICSIWWHSFVGGSHCGL